MLALRYKQESYLSVHVSSHLRRHALQQMADHPDLRDTFRSFAPEFEKDLVETIQNNNRWSHYFLDGHDCNTLPNKDNNERIVT